MKEQNKKGKNYNNGFIRWFDYCFFAFFISFLPQMPPITWRQKKIEAIKPSGSLRLDRTPVIINHEPLPIHHEP